MKYTLIKQHDSTDCAAACIAMVCMYYKKHTSIALLRDLMGTDINGTNLLGMNNCAVKLGFATQAVRVDKKGLFSKYTLPAIANIVTKEGISHFVVIYKITKKRVLVADPADKIKRIDADEFYSRFTGMMLLLQPDDNFKAEKKNTEGMFSRFIRLLLPQKKLFAYTIIASIILTILGIVSSIFNKIIMDDILPYKLKNTLLSILIVFLVIAVTRVIIGFIRQWMMIYLAQKIDIPLMLGYFEHIYSLPMKFFATRKTGDIITRFSDAYTIKDIFTNIALTLIMDIFMAVVTGIVLGKMNISLFMIIFIMTILSIILVCLFKKPYKIINEEQMQQESVLNSQIIEGLRGIETIKSNANEEAELECIEREYIKSLRIAFKESMLSNIQGTVSGLFSTAGNLILLYFGIMQVINGDITLGGFMAFTTLSGYFMEPVSRLVGLQLQIQEAGISMKRMAEILDYKSEESKKGIYQYHKKDIKPDLHSEIELEDKQNSAFIEFKNVSFAYGNRKKVLNNVSFRIEKGKKVALVGTSGSGKSTIAKLLLKYYEKDEGDILIGGNNIEEWDNKLLRNSISYVPQNIELFSKTILDNIRISRHNASLEDVKKAARMADAHNFIMNLPLQYDTYLEEAGNGLSGGEKQRIALARAFLKKNSIFILDESTSNLDFGTENLIFDILYNKLRDKTMLIIAHRLATVRYCDDILVVDKGEIIEQGTHEQLIALKGAYYKLWEMQQGKIFYEKKSKVHQELREDDMEYTYSTVGV